MENSTEHSKTKLEYLTFTIFDYGLFCGMLVVSALIGVYFGVFKKQTTANDYLMGGRNMGVIPIAVSLTASYVSAITLLGMPAEVYMYGTLYIGSCLGGLVAIIIIGLVFLPVFYELHLTSTYEYLEMRFCKKVRLTASFLYIFESAMTVPIVMYVPAIAFNLVTGKSIAFITPIVCCVCIFYTTLGGIKAVVWTDTIQFLAMNGTIIVILFLGVQNEGGLSAIWAIGEKEDRIELFNFDIDPTKRLTFWSVTIGLCFGWVSLMGVNQMCVQRFLSVPSLKDAHTVLYIYGVMVAIIKSVCLLSGLIMLSRYYGCDPVTAGIISRADQILPYYVMDTTRNIPGLPGLFIAGVFSAALSSMSSFLNTISGVIYKDFIFPFFPKSRSDVNANRIMRLIVVIVGIFSLLMVFVVERLGTIIQIAVSFSGLTNGATLGTFIMGMFFPRANSKGTITGAVCSFSFMVWIFYGNTMAIRNGLNSYPTKGFSMDECDESLNITRAVVNNTINAAAADEVFFLHRVSFMWYSFIGTLTMLSVAIPVSYLTKPPLPSQTRLEYFTPVIRKFLPKQIREQSRQHKNTDNQYNKVDVVLQTMDSKN